MEIDRINDIITIWRLADKYGIRIDQSLGRELPHLLDRRTFRICRNCGRVSSCCWIGRSAKYAGLWIIARWNGTGPWVSPKALIGYKSRRHLSIYLDCHALGVAAEKVNHGLYPFESEPLIIQARISSAIGDERGPSKPSESIKLSAVSIVSLY
jgi:hypothetical protein